MDMILFLLAAGLILAYGALYALYCIQKGGITAALSVFFLLLMDLGFLVLLVYYRTNT